MPSGSITPWVVAPFALVLLFQSASPDERRWLAGDSHVHSQWSPGYDRTQQPPVPVPGDDAIYSTPLNARMARRHGLSWLVTTDHGGPNHARFNMTQAYEELKASRDLVPEVLQFYGMELNMPGMDHHTLIVPHHEDEWSTLFEIESRFDANETWPLDPARNTEGARLAALDYMRTLDRLPLLFANHPSRSATATGVYGRDEPWELRANNDRAPAIYRGMEGAPGHQAATLEPDGTQRRNAIGEPAGRRGNYGNAGAPTFGGFDQMTARVGGMWDALLGEGRRFWIVATSDSHVHYTATSANRRGFDFWPGEFQKTYVLAWPAYEDILDGLRGGRVFVVAGDLVTELEVTAEASGQSARVGGALEVEAPATVNVTIRFVDPDTTNGRGDNPRVRRLDLIRGRVRPGPRPNPNTDSNESTRIVARFSPEDWNVELDGTRYVTTTFVVTADAYLRVRGTSTTDLEPMMDEPGEDPWSDLWFYSNPIFIEVHDAATDN